LQNSGCSTPIYKKGDGFPACGILLERKLNFSEAEEKCKNIGGKLPEIASEGRKQYNSEI